MSGVRTRPPHDRPARGKSGPERFLRELIGRRELDFEAVARAALAPRLARRDGRRFGRAWLRTLRLLRPLGAVSQGNRISVLCDGDEVFEAMWRAIGEARHSVFLDIYIFEPDRVGKRMLAELTSAAERGCEVVLMVDSFGSHRLSAADLAPLQAAGGKVHAFNPLFRARSRFSRLVRNHRKVLAVDGRIAFCGGMNIGEDYAGKQYGTGLFCDTQLVLVGPCARDLALLTAALAAETTGYRPALPPMDGDAHASDGSLVLILESDVARQREAIQKALRTTISRALERCYLSSPYFVPPRRLVRRLVHAARRGVDVRVLTAGRSDVPLVRLASQHLYGRLLRGGVRIYEMTQRTLHSKAVTIDGVFATVGSFNLDHWSHRRNLEVNVGVLDRATAVELEKSFQTNLEGSFEVQLATWERRSPLERFVHWLAYQILRI